MDQKAVYDFPLFVSPIFLFRSLTNATMRQVNHISLENNDNEGKKTMEDCNQGKVSRKILQLS